MFEIDKCTKCGICLESCPVIDLNIEQAKQEIVNLINGSSIILNQCAICGTCDLNCPLDLTPMELIRELKYKQTKELDENGKIPRMAKFLFPFNKPNVFEFYEQLLMKDEERNYLKEWKTPSNCEELVLLGCSISYLMQHLYQNPTLEGLLSGKVIAGGIEFCCGEIYHRTCYPLSKDDLENNLLLKFKNLGVKKLILFCNECYEAYKHEYKKISDEFEIVSIWEYITKAIKSGELKISNPLNLKVAFHDACVVKKYPELLNYPREIVEATGCEIVELDHNRENSLCCGLSLGLINRDLAEKTKKKRFNEFKKAGSDFFITTCPGCISTFSMDYKIQAKKYKVLSVLELLRMACGEKVDVYKNIEIYNNIVNKSMEQARARKALKK